MTTDARDAGTGPAGSASAPPERDRDLLRGLYRELCRVRQFEDAVARLVRQGKVLGGVYSGRGQEAIVVGACYGLRRDDLIAPVHRDIGAFLVKGMTARQMMCQAMARGNSPSRGKASWTHTGDLSVGIIGSTSMLASSMPIALGAALARRMQGRDSVAVSFFGEGSTARGDFHEALNFAGILDAPCVWICENNHFAFSTRSDQETAVPFIEKARSYGLPGLSIDGNDVLAVHDAVTRAVVRARSGEGGTLIECVTYRMEGHSESDQAAYRTPEELEEWTRRDPIERLRMVMLAAGFAADELASAAAEVEAEIRDAVEFASASPLPEGSEAAEDLYDEAAGVTHWSTPYPATVRVPWLGR